MTVPPIVTVPVLDEPLSVPDCTPIRVPAASEPAPAATEEPLVEALLIVPEFAPTRPPTAKVLMPAVTRPVELELLITPKFLPTRPPARVPELLNDTVPSTVDWAMLAVAFENPPLTPIRPPTKLAPVTLLADDTPPVVTEPRFCPTRPPA